jgi:hypothetical protein
MFWALRLVQGVHTRVSENFVKPTQGVHLNSVSSSEKSVLGGHTRIILKSEGALELLNTLEESLCREGTRDRVVEHSVSSVRSALSECKECTRELCFEFCGKISREILQGY